MVEIRPAIGDDLDAVKACVEAAYTPYIEEIGVAPAPLADDYATRIADGQVWVALAGADLVGVLVMLVEHDHILIDNFAVLPAWQGRGISKQLTTLALREARRRGLAKLRLYTHARMTRNLAMYRRRGWVEIDRRIEDGFDRVYMERALGSDEGW